MREAAAAPEAPRPAPPAGPPVPWASPAEAWWWAWDGVLAARAGLPPRRGAAHPPRPCSPHALLVLGMSPLLNDAATAVMADFGRLGCVPEDGTEQRELWDWAMLALGSALLRRRWLVPPAGMGART
jgi:hypothetical protein